MFGKRLIYLNKRREYMKQDISHPPLSTFSEWKRFLLLAFIGLPIVALMFICAYGFLVWFGQMLFWGPPS